MRRLSISPAAQFDIDAALEESLRGFGASAADRYQALIGTALLDVARSPERRGSKASGVRLRTYHLRMAKPVERVAKPRHLLVYRYDDDKVEIINLLHDAMDLPTRLRNL